MLLTSRQKPHHERSPEDEDDLMSPRQIKKIAATKRESSNSTHYATLELVSTINEQLDEMFKSKKIREIVFVNLRTRRGKKFGDFLKRLDGPFHKIILCTTGIEDIQIAISRISHILKNQT
jgi:hypothetical protein